MWQTYPKSGAILWIGETGLTKNLLRNEALDYARHLLTEQCERSGPLLDAKVHPDFKLIEPEEDKQSIKVDWIRELTEWAQSKPQIASRKVAIIYPADAMNLQAANAFLKTLEEPAPNTLFILVTERANVLPATIRSRCHLIRNRDKENYKIGPDPLRIEIQHDLEALLSNQTEPLSVASKWIKNDVQQVMYWLMVVLCEFTNNRSQDEQLVKSRRWWRFMEEVFEARKIVEDRKPVNSQLLIESLLIHYTRIVTGTRSLSNV